MMGIVLAGTGHRPDKLGGYSNAAYERYFGIAVEALDVLKPETVISGMALGWDTALAEAAYALGIPFYAFVPFEGQERLWPTDTQYMYRKLLQVAEKVIHCCEPGYATWKMQRRNEMMVDHADKVIALWNGSDGGTANCIEYACRNDVPVINLWDIYNDESNSQEMGSYIQSYEIAQAQPQARKRTRYAGQGETYTSKRITRTKR